MNVPGLLLMVTFVTYNLYDLFILIVTKAGTREMAQLLSAWLAKNEDLIQFLRPIQKSWT